MARRNKLSTMKTAARVGSKAENKAKIDNKICTPALFSDILPLPERKFQGRIGTYYTDSEAEVPSMPSAPPRVRPTFCSSCSTTWVSTTPALSAGQ